MFSSDVYVSLRSDAGVPCVVAHTPFGEGSSQSHWAAETEEEGLAFDKREGQLRPLQLGRWGWDIVS